MLYLRHKNVVSLRFLDTNILLRYLTRDDVPKAKRAFDLLLRIEQGEEKVITSPLVIFETIFTLQRFYRLPRQEIRNLVLPIISLRGLHLSDKKVYDYAFALYVSQNISFADAYNAAYIISEHLSDIYSWDTDFDKIEGITRLEPE